MDQLTTYSLDPSVRRVGNGTVLIGGSPLKLLRLSEAGARVVDDLARGDVVSPTPANASLLDRLLDAGIIQPHPTEGAPADAVTVVIPAFDAPRAALQRIVDAAAGASAVLIVDDASGEPIADVAGADVIRRSTNGGPGAARQTGLAAVATPFVAFVDTDVTLPAEWLAPLLRHFSDSRVALVAPRVTSTAPVDDDDGAGGTMLARYESVRSPLDLGPLPDRVRAGSRVSYVPTAVALFRVDALRRVGGFDETMRVGEDVDVVWRLDEAGWRVRYEPAVEVRHEARATLAAWIRQRYAYGTSAAVLGRKHPGAAAPLRVSGWSVLAWATTVAGWPLVGGAVGSVTTALLARKLRHVPDGGREAFRLAGLGHLYAGRSLASAITRAWWPIAAAAALVSRRARRAVLLAVIMPPVIDWLKGDAPVPLAVYVPLRILDDVSYGAGVARGAIRERSLDALIPDLTSWPKTRSTTKAAPTRATVANYGRTDGPALDGRRRQVR